MSELINTLIVKFASPCNLNCSYCYEYNTGDDSWKRKPKFFTVEKAKELNFRIREYVDLHRLRKLNIIAHGGEPLLMGAERLEVVLDELTQGVEGLNIGIQTNAVLVNEETIRVLKKFNVKCGVSLDGNPHHNRHRVFHNKKPTFQATLEGYRALQENKLVAGILCVVDFESDPVEILDALCALRPPQLDLLQPFLNHDDDRGADELGKLFFDWFGRAFSYYMSRPDWHDIQIRIFESALFSYLSHSSNSDWFGGPHGQYLVIETDGNYDILDHLKSIGSKGKSISDISKNISDCSIHDAHSLALDVFLRNGVSSPPEACKGCAHENACGGGYYPTRYSSRNNSLDNVSVYCSGLLKFFDLIGESVPERMRGAEGVQ